MQFPRLPDWAIYGAVAAVFLAVSLGRRENADAPPVAEADADVAEGALLGPITPFDAAVTVDAGEAPFKPSSGTAFSIAGRGRWVTARHVVEGCRKPALVVGEGRAVAADVRLAPRADVALLITDGGPAALPVAVEAPLRKGQRAFHPGFPQGRPGEVTSRLLGR
ncbi:S1 family peptidase, partial [Brevundimonas sp. UBA7838]